MVSDQGRVFIYTLGDYAYMHAYMHASVCEVLSVCSVVCGVGIV